jgi:hypothetical protein
LSERPIKESVIGDSVHSFYHRLLRPVNRRAGETLSDFSA